MHIKDNYLHSKYKVSGERVAIMKTDIKRYQECEDEVGTIIETYDGQNDVIVMTYDLVRESLQIKTVEIVGNAT